MKITFVNVRALILLFVMLLAQAAQMGAYANVSASCEADTNKRSCCKMVDCQCCASSDDKTPLGPTNPLIPANRLLVPDAIFIMANTLPFHSLSVFIGNVHPMWCDGMELRRTQDVSLSVLHCSFLI